MDELSLDELSYCAGGTSCAGHAINRTVYDNQRTHGDAFFTFEDIDEMTSCIDYYFMRMFDDGSSLCKNLCFKYVCQNLRCLNLCLYARLRNCLSSLISGRSVKNDKEIPEQISSIDGCISSLKENFARTFREHTPQTPQMEDRCVEMGNMMRTTFDYWIRLKLLLMYSEYDYCMHKIDLLKKVVEEFFQKLSRAQKEYSTSDQEEYKELCVRQMIEELNVAHTGVLNEIMTVLIDWSRCYHAKLNNGECILTGSSQKKIIVGWLNDLYAMLVDLNEKIRLLITPQQQQDDHGICCVIRQVNKQIQCMCESVEQLRAIGERHGF